MRLNDLARARVLVVGDVMLDRYVEGSVDRISPEAPVPVIRHRRERAVPGAGANVALNVAALGAVAALVAPVGVDEDADALAALLRAAGVAFDPVADPAHVTTVKTRILAGTHQLARLDRERTDPLAPATEARLLAAATARLAHADVLVLADYAKGCLTDGVLAGLIAAARTAGVPVLVDPKRPRFDGYAGAALVKPNRQELALATGIACDDDAQVAAAAAQAARTTGAAILVTRSERGMSLFRDGAAAVHVASQVREVFDVSGAGDTVIAALATATGAGWAIEDAMLLANHAAGVVVGKVGTATPSPDEIRASMADAAGEAPFPRGALLTAAEALRYREWCAVRRLSLGFTNGCFDLLHPGHVRLLAGAAAQCDRLLVALNTDASVRRLKGPTRPVQAEGDRAAVMGALADVAAVVLFDEDTPLELIRLIRPDVLVKGADYAEADIVGAAEVKAAGGRVARVDLVPGRSTTRLIARGAVPAP